MAAWSRVLVLSLGGILGVNARYWLGLWISRWTASHWATFVINTSGAFAIGFLATALAHWLPHPAFRLMVLTGFLGGYTTFSTFAFESVTLWERGERGSALINMTGSVAFGFLATFLGIALARGLVLPSEARRLPANRIERAASSLLEVDRRPTTEFVASATLEPPVVTETREDHDTANEGIERDSPETPLGQSAGS